MVDTRLKALDDSMKIVQDSQAHFMKELQGLNVMVSGLNVMVETQQKLMHEMLNHLTSLSSHIHDSRGDSSRFRTGSSSSSSVHGTGSQSIPTLLHKPTSVEFGRFSGGNPNSWVFQAKQYFDFYHILDDQKLSLASFYLEGEALEWYRWLYENKQLVDWDHFVEKLVRQFRKRNLEAPEGRAKLRQISTVANYLVNFEAVTNEIVTLLDTFLVHCFISGLRIDIKTIVVIHEPKILYDAISLAHLHEQRIALKRGSIRPILGKS
ncbi:hypothetical protein H6P81_006095 [Aristolochia fimbriata]|uniref:Retrotransposon gag domain-containing protein n=1 Tax=Aristolochia fimbriata TaxID=158543 RepID=A0AAV7EZ66_ARIFI|nr:hypothetical protein H6P81_006095 [Aristolochia fimbriata]